MSSRKPKTIRDGLAASAERPLAQLVANLPATAGNNPFDPIHDARVALRRLGALLRAFAPALPARAVAEMKREIRWLRRALGPARDLDVFIHETGPELRELFPNEPGLNALLEAARTRRAPLAATLTRTVASGRCRRTMAMAERLFGAKGPRRANAGRRRGTAAGPTLDSSFAPYARALLRRRYKKMREHADGLRKLSEDDLHRLRIRLRNFRYLCDSFRMLLPERRYAELRTAMQQLQDHMGALNDAATAPVLVASLARHAARTHNPALVARAAGFVAGWGAARRLVLRTALDEPWHRMTKRADRMFAAL